MEIIFRRGREKTKKQETKQKSAAYALPEATHHELQSDVQMAATCAGFGCAQMRPSCKPRPAVASAGPGAT